MNKEEKLKLQDIISNMRSERLIKKVGQWHMIYSNSPGLFSIDFLMIHKNENDFTYDVITNVSGKPAFFKNYKDLYPVLLRLNPFFTFVLKEERNLELKTAMQTKLKDFSDNYFESLISNGYKITPTIALPDGVHSLSPTIFTISFYHEDIVEIIIENCKTFTIRDLWAYTGNWNGGKLDSDVIKSVKYKDFCIKTNLMYLLKDYFQRYDELLQLMKELDIEIANIKNEYNLEARKYFVDNLHQLDLTSLFLSPHLKFKENCKILKFQMQSLKNRIGYQFEEDFDMNVLVGNQNEH